ncbi:hypothetical protein EGT74_12600 [Chitinophaga lutea]|uniref:Uncharacterized protein n=1 Tax=Chitinophaga lutea TaxID=2488634 RepID=A0A3N4PSD0_9BACT|nr:hypothetical protein [Chitinophaga lutea]RPE07911.1 hypothetical protein EGT74_12600 [Chitinophaga lutea]
MKKRNPILILAGILFAFSPAMAQKDSSGIYRTATDFQQRKLTYAINYKTEKHKIRRNILLKGGEIKVRHNGRTYTLDKNATYGFKDTNGKVFRFVGGKEYLLLNPDEPILLYEYKHIAHSPRETDKYPPEYYFSKDAFSAPQPLTKSNLKAAFPDNHKFHDGLDAAMAYDSGLHAYDSFHKMYKVNWILRNAGK